MSSDELSVLGILITVILGVGAFFIVTNRKSINITQKNKSGTINMNNNTIGNEINTAEKNKKKGM